MIKRLMAGMSALALMLAGLFTVTASPAQAAVYNCPDGGYVCFWNYESYNYQPDGHGGIYKFNLRNGYGSCHVMPVSGATGWTNGKVYNAASSLLINNTGANNLPGQMILHLYDNNSCTGAELAPGFESGELYGIPRLAVYGWNDRIGSFKVVDNN